MGIFSKLSTMIKSNINDLINRAENPEKMLNQIILDFRDQLVKAKREVAVAIADERRLRNQLDQELKQSREWEKRAMLAVRQGRDDLAKQALVRQQQHAERASSLDRDWRVQSEETEKLKGALRQLNDKIEEARRKRNLLVAKHRRAQAQQRIHSTMAGLSDTSAFDTFNRMAEKIEDQARLNMAEAQAAEAIGGDTLEDEFQRLESGSGDAAVDDRLATLKAEMGLLAGGESGAPRRLGSGAAAAAEAEREEGRGTDAAEGTGSDPGTEAGPAEERPIREADLLQEFERLEKGGGDGSPR